MEVMEVKEEKNVFRIKIQFLSQVQGTLTARQTFQMYEVSRVNQQEDYDSLIKAFEAQDVLR